MILDPPRLAALREFAADVHVIGSGSGRHRHGARVTRIQP